MALSKISFDTECCYAECVIIAILISNMRSAVMLIVLYDEYWVMHFLLCWVMFMLSVVYANCGIFNSYAVSLCWLSFMQSFFYAECHMVYCYAASMCRLLQCWVTFCKLSLCCKSGHPFSVFNGTFVCLFSLQQHKT